GLTWEFSGREHPATQQASASMRATSVGCAGCSMVCQHMLQLLRAGMCTDNDKSSHWRTSCRAVTSTAEARKAGDVRCWNLRTCGGHQGFPLMQWNQIQRLAQILHVDVPLL